MLKILNPKRKSISPLIATILLVVVAVILVVVLLNWSKIFTSDTLGKTDIVSFTKSDATYFVYPVSLTNGILQFNYNPPSGHEFGDFIAESYRVITDDVEYPSKELNTIHAFQTGLNILDLTGFKDLKLDDGIKVTILLESTDHYYVSLTLTNKSTGGDADLPYVMKGNQKLYIQPKGFANNEIVDNTFNLNVDENGYINVPDENYGWHKGEFIGDWHDANVYCEDLNAFGYDDWRLPTISDFVSIWDTYKINQGDECLFINEENNVYVPAQCINLSIKKNYAGFMGFKESNFENEWPAYWTITPFEWDASSFSVSGAYTI